MRIGLVGLPTVGKTTLFNLLTGLNIETAGFLQGKVESNLGIGKIPDERLEFLQAYYQPKKKTYATIEIIDVPGLVKGSATGKGLGNQFLENIRKVDLLVHVLRIFEDDNILHAETSINPMRDMETINLELLFADLTVIENRISRIESSKKITKENIEEAEVLKKCREGLEEGLLLHNIDLNEREREIVKTFSFLSEKPMILVGNVDEDQLMDKGYPQRKEILDLCRSINIPFIELCLKTEMEIQQLDMDDRQAFMEDLGIKESGIDILAKTAYDYLGLISFLTAGKDEVKAWTIKKDTKARIAAGKIHSDIAKGFIRAEVCRFRDLKEYETMAKVKEKGLVTLEGKEYIVQDGDIIDFRFNV